MAPICGPGLASFNNFVPNVQWFSDSIPYGVGCTNIAGPREPAYFAARTASAPFTFVGSQSFAGGANGLAVDPFCECVPGITAVSLNSVLFRIGTYLPDVVIYSGGTNDINAPVTVDGTSTGFSGNVFVAPNTGTWFSSATVGSSITITGATNGANNGTFTVTGFTDAQHVTLSGSHVTEVFQVSATATIISTAATISGYWSAALDAIWALRTSAHFQIIVTTILKRLDGLDSMVQSANALLAGVVAGKSYASSVTVGDVYAIITNPTIGVNMHDAVHPNDTGDTQYGNTFYTNTLAPVVAKARG